MIVDLVGPNDLYMIGDLVGPNDCYEIFLSVYDKLTLRVKNKINIEFV